MTVSAQLSLAAVLQAAQQPGRLQSAPHSETGWAHSTCRSDGDHGLVWCWFPVYSTCPAAAAARPGLRRARGTGPCRRGGGSALACGLPLRSPVRVGIGRAGGVGRHLRGELGAAEQGLVDALVLRHRPLRRLRAVLRRRSGSTGQPRSRPATGKRAREYRPRRRGRGRTAICRARWPRT